MRLRGARREGQRRTQRSRRPDVRPSLMPVEGNGIRVCRFATTLTHALIGLTCGITGLTKPRWSRSCAIRVKTGRGREAHAWHSVSYTHLTLPTNRAV